MARPVKKNIYERINDQIDKIHETEELLTRLNEGLKELYSERDKIEMEQLLIAMRNNNLTINKAMELLQSSNKK